MLDTHLVYGSPFAWDRTFLNSLLRPCLDPIEFEHVRPFKRLHATLIEALLHYI